MQVYRKKKPTGSSGQASSHTTVSPPVEPSSPVEPRAPPRKVPFNPTFPEPDFDVDIEEYEGETTPRHSRRSSSQHSDLSNPFEAAIREQEWSPQPTMRPRKEREWPTPSRHSEPISPRPNPPDRPESPFIGHDSRLASIMPGSLDVASMEDRPETTTQKDTWGSHTVYTFRVSAIHRAETLQATSRLYAGLGSS